LEDSKKSKKPDSIVLFREHFRSVYVECKSMRISKQLCTLVLCCAAMLASGCCTSRSHCAKIAQAQDAKLLCITANVDGSGRIIFTSGNVHYEHKNWALPTCVTFDDKPWNEIDRTPSGWRDFSDGLDLTGARIAQRRGRDVIALERTAEGFDLYLCDSPNGSADYEVTIAIPRRN
jgi:hypothetical protein